MTVDESNLNDLFVDKDGEVWRMISYCSEPQATFARISLPRVTEGMEQRLEYMRPVTHVIGCLNHLKMGLKRLVPEK